MLNCSANTVDSYREYHMMSGLSFLHPVTIDTGKYRVPMEWMNEWGMNEWMNEWMKIPQFRFYENIRLLGKMWLYGPNLWKCVIINVNEIISYKNEGIIK